MRSHSTLLLNVTSSAYNLRNLFAEWGQCQKGHLEVLQAERDAYDGDAEYDAEPHVQNGDFDATADNPDDVHQNRQATGVIRSRYDVVSERPESKSCHLEKLQSEWNTDDGQAEQQSHNSVIETDQNASEQHP